MTKKEKQLERRLAALKRQFVRELRQKLAECTTSATHQATELLDMVSDGECDDLTARIAEADSVKIDQVEEALRTLRSTSCFWRRYEVFAWCAMPLNGVLPDFEVMQVPTYAQALVAGDIAKVVRPDEAWSAEMRAYLRVVAEHDGVYCAVEPFGFLEFEPRGVLDPRDVQRAWPAVLRAGEAPEGETIVAEQLRRALSAHEYVLEARRSLTAQLPLVDRVV